ncbi:MAG: hypothetical protein KGN01_06450 [Patescibacteria group bacterium]|nr:hypothetical protein [Patescibacteria group bacterium]
MSETPEIVVWVARFKSPRAKNPMRSMRSITLKSSIFPYTSTELMDKASDAVEEKKDEIYRTYKVKEFQMFMNREQRVNRFKMIPLILFEVKVGKMGNLIKPIAWNTMEEEILELKKEFMYLGKIDPRPRDNLGTPDDLKRFDIVDPYSSLYEWKSPVTERELDTLYPLGYLTMSYGTPLTEIEGHIVGETDATGIENKNVGQRAHQIWRLIPEW